MTLLRTSPHVPALDGVRGLAILGVMILHAQMVWDGDASGWWRAIPELGQHGVDLFFVLSGFLITGILDQSRDSPRYFRNFYLRRALRIFPLYYLFLFIAFYVQPHLVHKPDVAEGHRTWFWLYLSNFLFARESWLETSPFNVNLTWSLSIEEQFYIVWPFIVLLFRGKTLRWICVWTFAVPLSFVWGAALSHAGVVAIYVLTPSRLDELAFGAWSVLSLRDPSSLKSFFLRNRLFIGLAALTVADCGFPGKLLLNGSQQLQSLAEVIDLFAFAASFAALLLSASLAGSESSLVKFLSLSPLRVYGKFSYFLYLFHWPILRALTIAIRLHDIPGTGRFGRLSGTIFFLAAFSFPLIAASLSWTLFEKQFLKLKHFFPANPVPRNVIN